MRTYPKPTRKDYEEFLVQVVYGPCTDYLAACIDGAYRDFCRTMHGFGKLPEKQTVRSEATQEMNRQFQALPAARVQTQEAFDDWHGKFSVAVTNIFGRASFRVFAGQMQKWINMSFKNIYVCGEARVAGFEPLYRLCHIPIDNIVLDQLEDAGLDRPNEAWSRWAYDQYIDFQRRIRDWCGNQPLLNLEHHLWIEGR